MEKIERVECDECLSKMGISDMRDGKIILMCPECGRITEIEQTI